MGFSLLHVKTGYYVDNCVREILLKTKKAQIINKKINTFTTFKLKPSVWQKM